MLIAMVIPGIAFAQRVRYSYGNTTKETVKPYTSSNTQQTAWEHDSYGDHTATYDAKGNILEKSDIGNFEYELEKKPYAISGATLDCSVTPEKNQAVTYTSFGCPNKITDNSYTSQFIYNGKHERVKMQTNSSLDEHGIIRYYIGNGYECDRSSIGLTERLYLLGDCYTAPVVFINKGSSANIYYILRDYLGSITHIIPSDMKPATEFSYDAWGRLRDPDDYAAYSSALDRLPLGRGYTGHEHLPKYGLINMNARLYDPLLGRFLSPDPYIQMPDMSQNFNRYSYALNNPLKYRDPDGEFFLFTIFNAVTDFVLNVANHGFNVSQYDWTRTVNSWKIDMGMFKGSPLQVLNKWTYGIFNSVAGYTVSQLFNTVGMVDRVTDMDGMLALSGVTSGNSAITIGHYSLGPDGYVADWRDPLFVHEYGHYMQTQMWGPLYFHVIAFPSLASAAFTSKWSGMSHNMRWFEVNASKLGAKHFDKYYGRGADGYVEGSENFFDINAFVNGGWTKYKNPRTGDYHQDKNFPISKPQLTIWDFIF